MYHSFSETKTFEMKNGEIIPVTPISTYLGSVMHLSLKDTFYIEIRIKKAS